MKLAWIVLKITILLMFFAVSFAYGQDDGRTVKIPVVFHILYGDRLPDNGVSSRTRLAGNSSMYLPKEKIEAELVDLNADFQNLNNNLGTVIDEYKKVIGNPNISFYLSEIKYVSVDKKQIKRPKTNTDLLVEKSPAIDPKKNLNVYISLLRVGGSDSAGVTPARSRQNYGDVYDVVNLNYKWVGLKYSLLTHEVGHWLDLRHTWDERQFAAGIDDIPLQKKHTDMDCLECPPIVSDQLKRSWREKGFKKSNFNNFMDYSGCRAMFSVKQVSHMREFLRKHRSEIWSVRDQTSVFNLNPFARNLPIYRTAGSYSESKM